MLSVHLLGLCSRARRTFSVSQSSSAWSRTPNPACPLYPIVNIHPPHPPYLQSYGAFLMPRSLSTSIYFMISEYTKKAHLLTHVRIPLLHRWSLICCCFACFMPVKWQMRDSINFSRFRQKFGRRFRSLIVFSSNGSLSVCTFTRDLRDWDRLCGTLSVSPLNLECEFLKIII